MAFLDDCARDHDPVADLQERVRRLERRLDTVMPDLPDIPLSDGMAPEEHLASPSTNQLVHRS
jgi:hypothetical protein